MGSFVCANHLCAHSVSGASFSLLCFESLSMARTRSRELANVADGAGRPGLTSCFAMCASCQLFVASPMELGSVLSLMVLMWVHSPMMLLCVFSRMVLIFNFGLLVWSFVLGWSVLIFVQWPEFLLLR